MLQAVVNHGGFAQAAAAIHKSQSSINHAVHKLEGRLGLQLLEVVGRKAQLTSAGHLMLRRAGQVLAQVGQLEELADGLARGIESRVRLAVDEVFPYQLLANALQILSTEYPNTRVELMETVLSGGAEKLLGGNAQLLVAAQVPQGFLGEPLMRAEFIAVAHPKHPLHQQGGVLNLQDLVRHRQIVVRDSASGSRVDSGWLGAEQRWTVSHVGTSVDMVTRGMGFAWLPESRVAPGIASGELAELPLEQGSRRYTELYLTYADRDQAGPVARRLGDLLSRQAPGKGRALSR
jgi:DNA-binding transcriptional LysR family regulator